MGRLARVQPIPGTEMSFVKATCEMPGCGWRSVDLTRRTAQDVSVIHVVTEHPEEYTRVTGKEPPKLTDEQRWMLQTFTSKKVQVEGEPA